MTSRMTAMPPHPTRRMEPEEFIPIAEAHLAAQGRFVGEANALADEVQANAELASVKASAAAGSAAAALASEMASSIAAATAVSAMAAGPFVAGANYPALGMARSNVSGRIYCRRVAGASAQDPAQDAATWFPAYAPWGDLLRVNADMVLQVGKRHHIDTSAPRLLQMPAGAMPGDWLYTVDVKRKAGDNNITLAGNGALMPGGDATYVMDVNGETVLWVLDAVEGWVR